MRHQRLVAPLAREVRRYASTDTSRQPAWRKMMNRMLGKEAEEDKKDSVLREELETKRAQDEQLKKVTISDVTYEIAPLPKRFTQAYVQTDHVDGLPQSIGSDAWVKQIRDEGDSYRGYAPSTQWLLSADQWAALLQHTLVEVLVLLKHGRAPSELCNTRRNAHTLEHTRQAEVSTAGGKISMRFSDPQHEQRILSNITEKTYPDSGSRVASNVEITGGQTGTGIGARAAAAAERIGKSFERLNHDRSEVKAAITQAHVLPKSAYEWLHIPIRDPAVKLAIFRRITQLTSRRVTNTVSGDAATLYSLVGLLAEAPRKVKLLDTKQITELKTDLPNVTVYNKRRSIIDREQDIGRWKLIERELRRRNLPITGSKYSAKQKISII